MVIINCYVDFTGDTMQFGKMSTAGLKLGTKTTEGDENYSTIVVTSLLQQQWRFNMTKENFYKFSTTNFRFFKIKKRSIGLFKNCLSYYYSYSRSPSSFVK